MDCDGASGQSVASRAFLFFFLGGNVECFDRTDGQRDLHYFDPGCLDCECRAALQLNSTDEAGKGWSGSMRKLPSAENLKPLLPLRGSGACCRLLAQVKPCPGFAKFPVSNPCLGPDLCHF